MEFFNTNERINQADQAWKQWQSFEIQGRRFVVETLDNLSLSSDDKLYLQSRVNDITSSNTINLLRWKNSVQQRSFKILQIKFAVGKNRITIQIVEK